MIAEIELCGCGMVFELPMINQPAFKEHMHNGVHERALTLGVCGPCFAFMCHACDHNRGTRAWRCRCSHSMRDLTTSIEKEQAAADMRLTWSLWISRGCLSETDVL